MVSYKFLLDIALILLSTKAMGLISRRMKMPQVVGALIAGIVLGPAALNILRETDFIKKISELGVIILMFTAGLETDFVELKKAGRASLIIALIGVVVPLVGGAAVAHFFSTDSSDSNVLLQNIFIGVILTATSVSISVETLKELGKLDTRMGSAILGAALIDDILGIIALTVITSFADKSVNIWVVLLKIVLFFVFIIVVGFLFLKLFTAYSNKVNKDLKRFAIIAFVFCLVLSYCAEAFFGVADITGAYFAGLIICNTQRTKYIASRFDTLSYLLLSPVFFASIGIEINLPQMSGELILFTALLLIVAIASKVVGCGVGARLCGYTENESLQIGIGMISRGEVALIVANRGNALGLMNASFYGPIVIIVVVTTIITPILLKLSIAKDKSTGKYEDLVQSSLVDKYVETELIDLADQHLTNMDAEYQKKDTK